MDFESFRCRYIYFRALSEVDGKRWASVAEFAVRYTTDQNVKASTAINRVNSTPPAVDLTDFEGFKVFPVPFDDQLNIKGIKSKKAIRSIRLVSTDGRVSKPRVKFDGDILTVDTRELLSGIYVLYFEDNGVTKKIKVVKGR